MFKLATLSEINITQSFIVTGKDSIG